MKLFVQTLLLLSLTVILLFSCQSKKEKVSVINNSDYQVLQPTNSKINIGTHNNKDIVRIPFSFKIKNTTPTDVSIEKVDVSCNCIKIISHPTKVRGYRHFQLKGQIDISHQQGHISKCIFINYNSNKILLLRLVGDIN